MGSTRIVALSTTGATLIALIVCSNSHAETILLAEWSQIKTPRFAVVPPNQQHLLFEVFCLINLGDVFGGSW